MSAGTASPPLRQLAAPSTCPPLSPPPIGIQRRIEEERRGALAVSGNPGSDHPHAFARTRKKVAAIRASHKVMENVSSRRHRAGIAAGNSAATHSGRSSRARHLFQNHVLSRVAKWIGAHSVIRSSFSPENALNLLLTGSVRGLTGNAPHESRTDPCRVALPASAQATVSPGFADHPAHQCLVGIVETLAGLPRLELVEVELHLLDVVPDGLPCQRSNTPDPSDG